MSQINFLEISKDIIPYSFTLSLEGIVYTFEIDYNNLNDYFTMSLSDSSGALVQGDKLILNKPLFQDVSEDDAFYVDPRYPQNTVLIPVDISREEERITFENLNNNIKISIFSREELNIEP